MFSVRRWPGERNAFTHGSGMYQGVNMITERSGLGIEGDGTQVIADLVVTFGNVLRL